MKYMRVLSRVELGTRRDEAVALQRKFEFRATGEPALPTIPKTLMFDIETLPGVEAFDSADAALDSEVDLNPGMFRGRQAEGCAGRQLAADAQRAALQPDVPLLSSERWSRGSKLLPARVDDAMNQRAA